MNTRLNIFDLDSGRATEVLRHDGLIEAPNWAPCGTYLLVNGQGRLFRVPLDAPELIEVDTGFATGLNNDHGISPDGALIAISDKTETGKSCIYTLPSGGGTPTRVTENIPSYWHGWSPDGASHAYAAFRNNICDVYTCPAGGGRETRLTSGFDHTDGPDYSPDGQWIWFNGARDGSMDLWRMRINGKDLQRMTADDTINWFPHPSPDGAHVLYLAYAPCSIATPQEHPAEKQVTLRLLAAAGGKPIVLSEIFGGQGSINVPCWAPDGKHFAYVDVLRD